MKESHLLAKTKLDEVEHRNMELERRVKIVEMKLEAVKQELSRSNTRNAE